MSGLPFPIVPSLRLRTASSRKGFSGPTQLTLCKNICPERVACNSHFQQCQVRPFFVSLHKGFVSSFQVRKYSRSRDGARQCAHAGWRGPPAIWRIEIIWSWAQRTGSRCSRILKRDHYFIHRSWGATKRASQICLGRQGQIARRTYTENIECYRSPEISDCI